MELTSEPGEAFYDAIDINLLCRICCKTSSIPLIPIYGDSNNDLASKIMSYLPINVLMDDVLPTKVCFKCANSVFVWHEFYQCCIGADGKFREILAKRGINTDSNETEFTSAPEILPQAEENYGKSSKVESALLQPLEIKKEIKQEIEDSEEMTKSMECNQTLPNSNQSITVVAYSQNEGIFANTSIKQEPEAQTITQEPQQRYRIKPSEPWKVVLGKVKHPIPAPVPTKAEVRTIRITSIRDRILKKIEGSNSDIIKALKVMDLPWDKIATCKNYYIHHFPDSTAIKFVRKKRGTFVVRFN